MNSPDFTISAIGAPLVEVTGDGPYTDRAGGVFVPDGVPTHGTVDLLNAWIRRWRVDAPSSTAVTIALTDSPYGALVDVRRCSLVTPKRWWQRLIEVVHWPFAALSLHGASAAVLAKPMPLDQAGGCTWRTVSQRNWLNVTGQGGDVVVVTFVTP